MKVRLKLKMPVQWGQTLGLVESKATLPPKSVRVEPVAFPKKAQILSSIQRLDIGTQEPASRS